MTHNPRERWIVVDGTTRWLCETQQAPRTLGLGYWTSTGSAAMGELLALADEYNAAQVWVHPTVYVDPDSRAQMWNLSDRDNGTWWQTHWRPNAPHRTIVIPALNDEGPGQWGGIWADAGTGHDLAWALTYWARECGLPFRGPAATGRQLLQRLLCGERDATAVLGLPQNPPVAGRAETAIAWRRPLTDAEFDLPLMASYDKHGQQLAAMSALDLPIGEYREVVRPDWHITQLPGYWQIELASPPGPGELPASVKPGPAWVTTPTLQLLRSEPRLSGGTVSVLKGYYWERHIRAMDGMYRALRRLRTQGLETVGETAEMMGAAIAGVAVKPVYSQTVGILGARSNATWDRTEDPWARPYWREAVIATGNANILRNLCRAADAGLPLPFAIYVDCCYYAQPMALYPDIGLRVGDGLGQYEMRDCVRMEEFRAVYRGGLPWSELLQWLRAKREIVTES